MNIRPDPERYRQLREEMNERADYDDYPKPPRRRRDDSDVHPWIQYAVKVGMPTALGAAIIAWVLHDVTGSMKTIVDLQRQALQQNLLMQQEHVSIRERIDRADRLQGVTVDILRAQCVNLAASRQERDGCLSAGSGR